ncbi:prepilin-type N-terminal cleavage/methylation domain-containing protein [Candidatus Saccharibacteria bacterium]|nr:prepilin-type N-terminal cleavage/methylation domain-containing protein [Candidatus Saccharibacteria bacterium]
MKKNDKSGFTIVELITAAVIGGIVIASASLIINNYSYLSGKGRNLVLSNSFAEAKVEALRSVGYNGLSSGATDITNELPAELSQPRSATLQIGAPSAGLKQIDIAITYSDQGINRSYSYRTYIGELGVGQ